MVDAPIRVMVPPAPEYLRIVRVVATSSAASAGLTIDRLDDLALAIDEACGALLKLDGATAIRCAITPRDRGVGVWVAGRGASPAVWPPDEWNDSLEALVLNGVASNVETVLDEGDPAIGFDIT